MRSRCDVDQLTQSSTDVENEWMYTSTPPPPHMTSWRGHGQLYTFYSKYYLSNFVYVTQYSRTPPMRKLVIRTANYPDRLGPSSNFVENSTKLTCPEITSYRIQYSTALWLLELQSGVVERFRRGYIL